GARVARTYPGTERIEVAVRPHKSLCTSPRPGRRRPEHLEDRRLIHATSAGPLLACHVFPVRDRGTATRAVQRLLAVLPADAVLLPVSVPDHLDDLAAPPVGSDGVDRRDVRHGVPSSR